MLTQKRLKQLLHYDPNIGVFTWKTSTSPVITPGDVAGYISRGYVRISVDRRLYFAHRLAWLYEKGNFPTNEIDHINGDKSDNRISNLREVLRNQNMQNTRLYCNNTSGHKGVIWYKRNQKWGATVFHKGRRYFAGLFQSKEEAHAASFQLRNELFTHHNTDYSSK